MPSITMRLLVVNIIKIDLDQCFFSLTVLQSSAHLTGGFYVGGDNAFDFKRCDE